MRKRESERYYVINSYFTHIVAWPFTHRNFAGRFYDVLIINLGLAYFIK